jgi:hypothetical protein
VDSGNVAPVTDGRQEAPENTDDLSPQLSPEAKRLFLSANLYVLFRKIRRGAPIERHEIADLLPYTESTATRVAA